MADGYKRHESLSGALDTSHFTFDTQFRNPIITTLQTLLRTPIVTTFKTHLTCNSFASTFNIQQLYVLPTLYLCVLYLSENKQRLVPHTA